jgi:ribonucleoside-diphosphate reductase alpha chain
MPNRERLPNRRPSVAFNFEHQGQRYRATATRFPDGRLAELFLDCGKVGSTAQQYAESAAILASLLLQNHVSVETIIAAVSGPIAVALSLAISPR